jgi:ribosomal-protein-alanine N-acetyltransferase
MNPGVNLCIGNGFLRSLVECDVHQGYVDGLNEPLVNRYLNDVKAIRQTMRSVRDFVAADRMSSTAVLWGIWINESAHHVGTIRLHGIEQKHGTAHIGVCIFDKKCWGRGVGSAAIRAVTRWAIDVLELRWIEAGVYEDNVASQRAFLSAGYSWKFDITGKYLHEGAPATVKIFAALRTPGVGIQGLSARP